MASFTEKIDGSYTLQTLNSADTITLSGPTANSAVVVIEGDFTVTGNATLLGNITADALTSGNSNVTIVSPGGNIAFGVTGTTNAMVVGPNLVNVAGNISAAGNINGNYFLGNGIFLAGIATGIISNIGNAASTVTIPVANGNIIVNVAGTGNTVVWATTGEYVTGLISATGNISAGGTLNATGDITGANIHAINHTGTVVSVTGSITGGNISTAGLISATGNITGGNILGGANVNAITHTGTTVSVTGNITGGNLNAAGLSLSSNVIGNLSLNSTANIAAGNVISRFVGNLTGTSVTVTATVTGGNISTAGVITATGNITGGNILGGANVNAITHTGTTVLVTGNITGGNILGGANVNATTHTGTTVLVTGNITGGNLLTAGLISATGNITGGNILGGANVNATNGITNGQATGVGNIGTSAVYFNTVFAKATSALYADLAESYSADANYVPGTVLSFGGSTEVTVSTIDADRRVAGIVSTNPSYHMNTGLQAAYIAVIALQGRVPAKVVGQVRKGDTMVSAGNGAARAEHDPRISTVIGKALEDFTGESGIIEIAVGRF